MAKKANKPGVQPAPAVRPKQATAPQAEEFISEKDPSLPAWLYDFKVQAIVVALLAIIFYINTSKNEYALDDTIVIVKNEYVHQGFAGIHDIMTKDAFDSYYRQFNSGNQLAGGRYRPLSIASFAVEQQFFGAIKKDAVDSFIVYGMSYEMKSPSEKKFLSQMHTRHFINVLLYALSAVVLLYFLRYIVFKHNYLMAFIAAVLFTIHPMHTEVVANVKSRDEIMSLLFICLTFIYAFKYHETKKMSTLITALVFYLLAFLSKEYAIAMIALLPLAFFLFNGFSFSKSVMATLPYLATVGVYGMLRLQVIGEKNPASDADILNNPYAFATDAERIATQISTSLNYLKLLIFPHPLSSDYSYNTIPYKSMASPQVWLSIAVYGFVIWLMIKTYKFFSQGTREYTLLGARFSGTDAKYTAAVLCFGLAFYMAHFLLICNLIFNIGATMGERLIYHSSVGFSIVIAFLLYRLLTKVQGGRVLVPVLLVALIGICGFTTIERNKDWMNDQTLFNEDINKSPNSVLVNANVASSLINKSDAEKDSVKKREDLLKGIKYYDKTVELHPTFVAGYMNRGVAFMKLNLPDSAQSNYERVLTLYPNYPKMYEVFYNLGVCYYMNHQIGKAVAIWQRVLKMNPDPNIGMTAQQSINTANQQLMGVPQVPQAQAQPARPATPPAPKK